MYPTIQGRSGVPYEALIEALYRKRSKDSFAPQRNWKWHSVSAGAEAFTSYRATKSRRKSRMQRKPKKQKTLA
jgi:hypothetical protein